MPVDVAFPGLSLLHLDPLVLLIESFFTAEECEETIKSAVDSGELKVYTYIVNLG
jgi:hypothetical protein